jgi:predicted MFS family arabinose efflux permease
VSPPAAAPGDDALTAPQLAIITSARLALIAAIRLMYPLQPFLAQQLSVDLRTVSLIVTVQLATSMLSPLGGYLADTRGARTTMLAGVVVFCVGVIGCALSTTLEAFLIGYALIGLAIALYQPAAQGYISGHTRYARRARALGILETSWALAAMVGVAPLMLLVQQQQAVSGAFWLLAGLGIAAALLVGIALPGTPPAARRASAEPLDWAVLRRPAVLAACGMALCAFASYNTVVVVQSAWVQSVFVADEATLGWLFGVAGAAELLGALMVAAFADRIGKRRTIAVGFGGTALMVAVMPLTAGHWAWFIASYALYFFLQEIGIVAMFPLASEIVPRARGTVLALVITMTGLGSVIGSQLSEPIWRAAGFSANGLAGAALLIGLLGCVALIRSDAERTPAATSAS